MVLMKICWARCGWDTYCTGKRKLSRVSFLGGQQSFLFTRLHFDRACAPVSCAQPSFWGSLTCQTPMAASPKNKKIHYFQKQKASLQARSRVVRGAFHWAKLHPNELYCILLSYAALSWATLHPIELRYTLLSYAAFNWATLHHIWAMLNPKSYGAP